MEGSNYKNDTHFDWYFPTLALALRDFSVEMKVYNKKVSPDDYLEHCLQYKDEKDDKSRKYNESRKFIRKYFKYRHLFAFGSPGGGSMMKNLDRVTFSPDRWPVFQLSACTEGLSGVG